MKSAAEVRGFLCHYHRTMAVRCAVKAAMFWNNTMLAAREAVYRYDWQTAVFAYGKALELADILLANDGCPAGAQTRYARTAVEFIYARRKTGDGDSINPLLMGIVGRFEQMDAARPINELIGPVLKAAQDPVEEVDVWIAKLVGMEQARHQHLH